MRVLHLADAHLGKLIRGQSRLEEFGRILDHAAEYAIANGVHLVILAGDTFDTSRPGPEAIRVFARFVRRIRAEGMELIVTPGNHDGPTAITDALGKTTGWLAEFDIAGVHAFPEPTLSIVTTKGGDLAVYALPYPHKRSLDHLADKTIRDKTEAVSRAVEDMIREPGERQRKAIPSSIPFVFVGHLSTLNAELSEEQAMRLGWDVTVRPEVFEPYDFAFLGHVHRQQRVTDKVWYAGSPFFGDFGETTQQKGYLHVDLETTAAVHVPAPAIPMRKYEIGPDWDAHEEAFDNETTGYVLVKLLPSHDSPVPKGLKADIRRTLAGAQHVWIETVNPPPIRRVRSDKPVVTASNPELVEAFLKERGLPLAPTLDLAREIMATVDR